MVKLHAAIDQVWDVDLYRSPFNPPQNVEQKLWRYVSFSKFESLIRTSALYLRRVDSFSDSLEGVSTKATEIGWQLFFAERELPVEHRSEILRWQAADRLITYANCWRMDDSESERCWQDYCSSSDSVCLVTTFERIEYSWAAPPETCRFDKCHLGTVFYFDRLNEGYPIHNGFMPFMFKDKTYKWEAELRILKRLRSLKASVVGDLEKGRSPITPISVDVPVIDIQNMITEVILHPTSSESLRIAAEELLLEKKLNIQVSNSALALRRKIAV